MGKIRAAIVGVGNCASSLVQGVAFYRAANDNTVGLMHHNIGGFEPTDIEFVLAFDIVGNQNIGGIVEQVDVLDKSTLRDPEFIDCMRQSFLSVTFPPPEGGGMVTVEYPIVFSPGDDDE